jgi:hypothetical protein
VGRIIVPFLELDEFIVVFHLPAAAQDTWVPCVVEAGVARLRSAVLGFRNEIVTGSGGAQILLDDPSGNPIELLHSAR